MTKEKSPRKFTSGFKLNLVLEAYASGSFSETAAKHGIHITQINNWKRHLLTQGYVAFETKNNKKSEEQRKIDQLEKALGRLALENTILKKTEELLS